MPEQFSLDGVLFGQRWVCTPDCREARVAVSPLLEPCHYMTLYLMRDAGVLPAFFDLAERLRQADRFFADRPRPSLWALRSPGPLGVAPGQGVGRRRPAPPRPRHLRRRRSPCGRRSHGGPPRSGRGLVVRQYGRPPPPQAARAADPSLDRHITVAFIDGDLATTASQLGQWCLQHAGHSGTLEWAGPLDLLDRVNPIDTDSYDWFDRLTPQ